MTLYYWVGGSGDWTDPAHWALASGGAGGNGPPGPADDVWFDTASAGTSGYSVTLTSAHVVANFTHRTSAGARTLTLTGVGTLEVTVLMEINSFNGSAVVALESDITLGGVHLTVGVLSPGSKTIYMKGNFDLGTGTFSYGTSTVRWIANGQLLGPAGTILAKRFWNLTVDDGVTLTLTATYAANTDNLLTVNGTVTGNYRVTADALAVGANGFPDFHLHFQGGNLPGGTYRSIQMNSGTHSIQGKITTTANSIDIAGYSFFANNSATVNTNGYEIEVQGSGGLGILTGAIINAGASLFRMSSVWDHVTGTFNRGTSTVRWVANAQIKPPTGSGAAYFHNITIDAGVIVTGATSTRTGHSGVLTIDGTFAFGSILTYDIRPSLIAITTPIVFGPSGTWTAVPTFWFIAELSNQTINIPSRSDFGVLGIQPASNTNHEWRLLGPVTCASLTLYNSAGTELFFGTNYVRTQGYPLTVTSQLRDLGGTVGHIGLVMGASIVVIGSLQNSSNIGFFLDMGSADLTVNGSGNCWVTVSTSSYWSAGTSTTTFTSGSTQTIAGGGTKNIFNTIRFSGAGRKDITGNIRTGNVVALSNVTVRVTHTTVTWEMQGTLIQALAGFLLTLESSLAGTPWFIYHGTGYFDPGYRPGATRVRVTDSNACLGTTFQAYDGTCQDGGGNSCWNFSAPPPSQFVVLTIGTVIDRLHRVMQTDSQARFAEIPAGHYVLDIDSARLRLPSVWTRLDTLSEGRGGGGYDIETYDLKTTITLLDPTGNVNLDARFAHYAEGLRALLEDNPRLSLGSAEPRQLNRVHYAARRAAQIIDRGQVGPQQGLYVTGEISIRVQVVRLSGE